MKVISVALSLALALLVGAVEYSCEDKQVVSTSYVGASKNVKAETISCSNTLPGYAPLAATDNSTDPSNVCGANCTTNCFYPAGGGPDPNDCAVIADALLYDGQNIGPLFNITANTSGVAMTYASCYTFFLDQASYNLTYCRNDWSTVLNYVAVNCQATQNAHGGNCVATDQRWFIQVQNSTA
ncbi:hypothetical protein HYDPIDRAFT_112534 [Hydnomerulius pinastri MD-312]|uniref:Uncharacterized protein n=1 Tax=Hydnomerulius pinastri MD-312 TaxID=994086 RepID=A0A0C9VEM8_9AGAM|nr:hypothetical protein HYDPIDRAFT_112534 [Hydnomerulius pinastri MD-312]